MEFINIRVFFSKLKRAKYISHLDLNHCMQRALRRSKLPIWQTEGFNPHSYVTFALPLSLGTESICESMDTRITEDIPFDEVKDRLNAALPEDIRVLSITEPKFKCTEIESSVYEIDTDCNIEKFKEFLALPEILTEKRTKKGTATIDIKPMIKSAEFTDGKITLTLPSGVDVNLNPNLVFDTFSDKTGEKLGRLNITRTQILCKNGEIFR